MMQRASNKAEDSRIHSLNDSRATVFYTLPPDLCIWRPFAASATTVGASDEEAS